MVYQPNANLFNTALTREDGALFHEEFALNSYVKLPLFLNNDSFANLKTEVLRMFEQHSRRRHFNMEHQQNTPRHLSTVSGIAIAEQSQMITTLYRNSQLIEFLCGVATTQVYLVPEPDRRGRSRVGDAEEEDAVRGRRGDAERFSPCPRVPVSSSRNNKY
jgi:hypothetical protein